MMSARVYEDDIGDVETRDRALPQASSRSIRSTSRRPSRSSASSARRSATRTSRSSSSARRRSSTSRPTRRTRSSRPPRSRRTSSSCPRRPSPSTSKVLALDEDDLRALDALIKRYLGLSRWADLLAVYSKKADLVADPDEKKRIYYQVGAVYERELGDVPQAIDTYQKILELDPDDLQALSRLDVLYEQAQNWQELLGVLTRESEMCEDPNEAISFQYRIAELYEKRLDDVVARHRALSRDPPAQADHEPTLRALEGLKRGDEGSARRRRGPRARLRGGERLARSSISVHEVQVSARGRPVHAGRPPPPHRAALRGRAREPRVGVRHVRARAVARQRQRVDAPEPRAARDDREPLAASGRALRRRARQARREPGALRGARSPHRADLRGAARGRRQRHRPLPARRSRSTPRTRPPFARSIASTSRRSAGPSSPRSSSARPRSGRRPTRSSSSSTASVRCSSTGSATSTRRSRRTATSSARRPSTRPRSRPSKASSRPATKQVEIAEILEPLYRAAGEWEKLAGVYEAQLTHTVNTEARRRAPRARTTASPSSTKRSSSTRSQTLDVYIRALKEFPLDEKSSEEAPRLAGIDRRRLGDARQRVRRRPRPPQRPEHPAHASAVASRRRSRTSSATSTRRRRRTATSSPSSRSTPRRSRTSIASTCRSKRGRSSRGILEMRVKAPADDARARRALRAPRRGLRERASPTSRHATVAFRRIFDGLDKTHDPRHPGPRAHLRGERVVDGAQHGLRARARERVGRRRRRRRSARSSRTSPPNA